MFLQYTLCVFSLGYLGYLGEGVGTGEAVVLSLVYLGYLGEGAGEPGGVVSGVPGVPG